jgi:hypothetical protein
VAGVGEQREAVGPQAREHLDYKKRKRQAQRDREPTRAGRWRAVIMGMTVTMSVTMPVTMTTVTLRGRRVTLLRLLTDHAAYVRIRRAELKR